MAGIREDRQPKTPLPMRYAHAFPLACGLKHVLAAQAAGCRNCMGGRSRASLRPRATFAVSPVRLYKYGTDGSPRTLPGCRSFLSFVAPLSASRGLLQHAMFTGPLALGLLALARLGVATPADAPAHHHHTSTQRLPARWYHEDSHPSHALFVRDAPAVGSAGAPLFRLRARG
jgi:hypothetical protein